MKQINIYGDNYNGKTSNVRVACRAFIVKDGKILISYENKNCQLMLPGGGLENNESFEDCLVREIEEETGYIVIVKNKIVTINEYYEDYLWINHYFVCEIIGDGKIKLSKIEQEQKMESKWFNLDECFNIFKEYNKYSEIDVMRCGMYKRELLALKEYIEFIKYKDFY